MAQYEEARAALRYARADYYPTIGAVASASRERNSDNRPATLAGGVTLSDFVLPVNLSCQVNAWGRVGKNVESYREQAQASAADLAVVNLTSGGWDRSSLPDRPESGKLAMNGN